MDKKLELIQKASVVFQRYGIKSVTMADLSSHLGISKKTIYQHFKDKNELIENIMSDKLDKDKEACVVLLKNSANAIDVLNNVVIMITENFGVTHPTVFYDLQKYHVNAFDLITKYKNEFVFGFIRDNIIRGQEEGLYRTEIDVEIISQLYVRMTDPFVMGELIQTGQNDLASLFHEIIAFMLHGLVTEKGKIYVQSKYKQND